MDGLRNYLGGCDRVHAFDRLAFEQSIDKRKISVSKFIKYVFTFENTRSVLFVWTIVIVPQVFARFQFMQSPDHYGLFMIQLYGAIVAAWGAIYFYYFRTNNWNILKGLVTSTMAVSPTLVVMDMMIANGLASLFVTSYLLFTLFGSTLRVLCLFKPALYGLDR